MTILRPFKAIRPREKLAHKVAALPYDVMSSEEAKKEAENNPYSFLHVDKAEIDLDPSIGKYDLKVYEKARDNFKAMIDNKILIKDKEEKLYIYKQIMDGKKQVGLVGSLSIDDYINKNIKKHENILTEKLIDRTNHINYCNANTGPIFLTYRPKEKINKILEKWMDKKEPIYDFLAADSITHMVWNIDDNATMNTLVDLFKDIDSLYIADGHHRTAAAAEVAKIRRAENPRFTGKENFNYFLGVMFPSNQLFIMDYNRIVSDLNGLNSKEFIEKLRENFILEEMENQDPYKPKEKHSFGMYLENKWYKLKVKDDIFKTKNLLEKLDVSILQNKVLDSILGIKDPSSDKRIEFIGGIRGLRELEKRVDKGMAVAFSLYPTSIEDLMEISDKSNIMPAKSTWFEPKLRSGLFIHDLG
ncbi:MAG: DUF1015 domain-containing protein [Clostridium sp.]|nr:DUF1015 domain-containing protein [Clostridium sp.]